MDVIDDLKSVGTMAAPRDEVLARVRTDLLIEARRSRTAPAPRRRLPHRLLTSVAAAAFVSGGTAAVWVAVAHSTDPRTTTTIECGDNTYIPEETGNPILDCHNALASQSGGVPKLVGWVTPTGMVAVLPVGEHPPLGSTPLPTRFQVDAGVRFVTDALSDTTGALQTGCLPAPQATTYAESQLAIAGLSRWHVKVDASTGLSGCLAYTSVVQATSSTVVLEAFSGGTPAGGSSNPAVRLDDLLHAQLVSGHNAACLSTREAEDVVAQDLTKLDIPANQAVVSDAGSIGTGVRCATPFVVPGGFYDVVLWQAPGR